MINQDFFFFPQPHFSVLGAAGNEGQDIKMISSIFIRNQKEKVQGICRHTDGTRVCWSDIFSMPDDDIVLMYILRNNLIKTQHIQH